MTVNPTPVNMDMKVTFKGGGSFVNIPPKFSSDGDKIFVSWNNTILAYNTKTGKVVGEFKGITERIVGFDLYTQDANEFLIAGLKNGDLVVWKTESYFRIMTKKTGKKDIQTFHLLPSATDVSTKVLVSHTADDFTRFALLDMDTDKVKNYKLKLSKKKFILNVGQDYFCAAQGNRVHFVNIDGQQVSSHHIGQRNVTAVACHPLEESVLVGDSQGRAVLWQGIFTSNPSQTVFHWHTLPVRCLGFSKAGSSFYSGGDECVLVQWRIDNAGKKFLPRLPSSIVAISISNNNVHLAIATSDNGIRVIDTYFNTVSLIQHLVIGSQFYCGILYDPRTRALVMNGNIGQVQFYNPSDMTLMYKLDIVDQNKITNERNCVFENTQVTKIAISKTGSWMSTFEERRDEEYTPEIRLKFWRFNAEKQNFELNSSIEFPHEKPIRNLMFQPVTNDEDSLICVSVGEDSRFKIWQLMDVDSIYKKGKIWNCISEGFYRNLPCKGLSFSMDGSLVAVGFGPTVTAWIPDTCEMKCSLTRPFQKNYIEHIEFGYSNCCHLLVATTSYDLSVWNVLTLSVMWTVPLNVSLLISDPITTNMAVITTDNRVFLFSPLSNKPIFSSNTLLKNHKKILAASFIPSKYASDVRLRWYQRSHIFFIDADKELHCIGEEDEYLEPTQDIEDTTHSLLGMMISKANQKNGTIGSTPVHHMFEKDAKHVNIKKYLEAPIHTMVPIRLSCRSLLQSLVLQKD